MLTGGGTVDRHMCLRSAFFAALPQVLAGLWPLQAGEVTTPDKQKVFYLSQRPYLVSLDGGRRGVITRPAC